MLLLDEILEVATLEVLHDEMELFPTLALLLKELLIAHNVFVDEVLGNVELRLHF